MTSAPTALPELWTDWCEVTSTPIDRRDEKTLRCFARQASPSRRLLTALRQDAEEEPAPAWPATYRDDAVALERLIHRGTMLVESWNTHWVVRLRLRRLLFASVLLAPTGQGGLGLSRRQAIDLTPDEMRRRRSRVGKAQVAASCPACAVWSWLDVLGTNNGWSQAAVRSLACQRDEPWSDEHRHDRPDASPDWRDCVGLLPGIDRWGWVDSYSSLHPSSLSILIRAMGGLLDGPVVPVPATPSVPASPVRGITPEDEAQVLARADELNARIAEILNGKGDPTRRRL
jgi:hypothetical protein